MTKDTVSSIGASTHDRPRRGLGLLNPDAVHRVASSEEQSNNQVERRLEELAIRRQPESTRRKCIMYVSFGHHRIWHEDV